MYLLTKEEREKLGSIFCLKIEAFCVCVHIEGAFHFLLSPEIEEDFALSSKSQSSTISILNPQVSFLSFLPIHSVYTQSADSFLHFNCCLQ